MCTKPLFKIPCWAAFILLFISSVASSSEEQNSWETRLKAHYFQEQEIADGSDLIKMDVPDRAEDGALVPIQITAAKPQTADDYIRKIWVIIDENPNPLVGEFELSPRNGKADIESRLRVNAYSWVRVVAQTNDDKLYMVSHFVKASSGCSAPAATDMETAMSIIGKIRIKAEPGDSLSEPIETTLAISHPNITGLQKDQVTTLFIPPHYVKTITATYEGETVFNATTDISISENPSFRFYFVPEKPGTLNVTVTDTKGNVYSNTKTIGKN